MKIFYNEFDPFAANWLRELQRAYHIPPGFIQEKSIEQVKAKELQGFKQAHFFAGIGGWPLALKLAGWPEGGAVWTGSCPCQPFSDAGLRKGVSDKRHLFPTWRRLIKDCLPPVIFGEQVASAAGRDWLAGVRADLEGLGYGVGGADLCAAGFGAPHIRQRLYWMAYARSAGRKGQFSGPQKIGASADAPKQKQQLAGHGTARRLDHGQRIGRHAQRDHYQGDDGIKPHPAGQVRRLGDPSGASLAPSQPQVLRGSGRGKEGRAALKSGGAPGPWSRYYLIPCSDGKTRRVGAGLFPLADGIPHRVGKLRGAGNAIVPVQAATFVRVCMEFLGVV